MFNLIANAAAAGSANAWHGMMPGSMCVTVEGESPYGLIPALCEGGIVSQVTFLVLLVMFVGTLYILFTKLFEQNKVMSQGKAVEANFWRSATLADGMNKLEKNSAYRQVVEDGLRANEEHNKLTNPVEAHDGMHAPPARSQGHINSNRTGGSSLLSPARSPATFPGPFGTGLGIRPALVHRPEK